METGWQNTDSIVIDVIQALVQIHRHVKPASAPPFGSLMRQEKHIQAAPLDLAAAIQYRNRRPTIVTGNRKPRVETQKPGVGCDKTRPVGVNAPAACRDAIALTSATL